MTEERDLPTDSPQEQAPQETANKIFDPFVKLRQSGFNEPQIQAWKDSADQRLSAAGYDRDEIGGYWSRFQVQPPKPPALPPQPAMPYYARALTGNAEERDVEDPFGARSRVRVGGAPQGEDFQMAARVIAQGAEPIAQTVEEKLRKLYDSRGMHPAEVATDAQGNLRLMQSLVSKGEDEAEHYDVRPGWGLLSKAEQEQEAKQRIAAGKAAAETAIPLLEEVVRSISPGERLTLSSETVDKLYKVTGSRSLDPTWLKLSLEAARNKVAEADAFEKGSHAPITQTAWRSTPRAFAAGALGSVASLGEGIGMARGWIGHWRAGHDIDDESLQQWIRSAKDWASEMFPADVGRQNDTLEHTASTLGMISGLYGAGGVAKLAGAGAKGVAWAMGVAGAVGQGAVGHEEGVAAMKTPPVITEPTGVPEFAAAGGGITTGEPQESRPISHGAVLAGTIGQTAVGAAMALPFAKMATRGLPHETRLGRALIGAGEQAVMFPAFGVAGNFVSRETYDPSRQLFTDFWQSMGVGTAVGFITGMAAKGMPTPRRAIEYTPAELQGMLAEHPAMAEEYKKLAKAVIADDFMPTLEPKVRNDLIYVLDQVDPELANQLHDHQLPGEPRGPLAPVPEAAPHLQELERRLNETVQGFVAGVPVRVFEGEARPGEEARYLFGGQGAAEASLGKLRYAEEMEREQASPKEIWDQTGWHKDSDGKWKFEIDDSKATINLGEVKQNPNDPNQTGRRALLSEIVNHEKLFKHYPYLGNVETLVVLDKSLAVDDGAGEVFEGFDKKLDFITNITVEAGSKEKALNIILHEVQHLIQSHEKFAKGARSEEVGEAEYQKAPGEIEARKVQERQRLTAEERRQSFPWLTQESSKQIMYSFGGQGAERPPFKDLTQAQTMERAGMIPSYIWEQTGWRKDVEGRWKFEIDDRLAFIDLSNRKAHPDDPNQTGVSARLGDILSHTKLFEQYPSLENIPTTVVIDKSKPKDFREGVHYPAAMGQKIYIKAGSEEAAERTLLHEAQHAIQEFEKFNPGSSPEYSKEFSVFKKVMADVSQKQGITPNTKEYERLWKKVAFQIYQRSAGEVEARNVEARQAMTEAERRDVEPWRTQDISDAERIVHDIGNVENRMISQAVDDVFAMQSGERGEPIIEGYFDPKARTIWVSAAALDPELVVREEAAHAIKALGLYTPDEWAQLTVEARDNGWIDAMPNRELYEQKYGHLSPELLADALTDEAVAKAFAGWRKGEVEVKGWVGQLFQRLANLLDRTGNWLKGQGFNTADDVGRLYGYQSSEQVFRAIEAGEFRRRQGELALREPGNVSRETEGAAGAGGPPMIPPTGAPPSRGFAPTPPPGGYTPQQIANARAAVLSRLSIGDPEQRQRFSAEQFYKNFLDKQYYVGKAMVTATGQRASGQEGLPTEANPYHLIRMAPGIAGKIDHFIMDGTFDFNTHEVTGEGLWPILDLIRGSAVDFSTFLASARNMELAGRGITTGIDVGASRIYGSSQTDRFSEPATRLYSWKDKTLAYLRDSGIISAESYDRIKAANKFHVAFHRVFDPEEQRMMISSTAQGGGVQPRNPVHTIKDNERRIVDPLESAIKDAAIFIKQAENNAITRSLVDMLMGFHAEAEAAVRAERVGEPAGAIGRQPIDAEIIMPAIETTEPDVGALPGTQRKIGKTGAEDVSPETRETTEETPGLLEHRPANVEATAPVAEGLPGTQRKIGETRAGLPAPVELLPSDIAPEARAAAEAFLRNNGIEGAPPELVDWVAAEAAGPLPAGQVAVYRNGRREIYRVDPELAQAIKGLNREALGLIEKVLALPAGWLRSGAVQTPQFGLRHIFRSYNYAFITAKSLFSPIDTARGLFSFFTNSSGYREWIRSGGANISEAGFDRDILQEKIRDMAYYGMFTRTWNVVIDPETSIFAKGGSILGLPVQFAKEMATHPVHTTNRYIMHPLRVWVEASEAAQHIGAFVKERKRQKASGEEAEIGLKAALQRAGWESRETGVDIRRIGASMQAFNMITAFSNIVLQDTDRVVRAFHDNPVRTFWRVGLSIIAPSVALWAINHNQKWYQRAEDWEKDLFWMFNTGTDDDQHAEVWRLPKPFSAGMFFGTGMERSLSAYFDGNKGELEKFIAGMHETSMPRLVPTAVSPLLEHWGNRSFFFNKNVVNKSQEQMLPEYQFTEYTTETAKAVARAISAIPGMREMALSKAASGHFMAQAMTSPVIMENYLRGWTGTLGMWALKTVDQAGFATGVYDRKLLPAATLADYPVIGSFRHRHPSAKAQNIQDFYDRYEVNTAYITTWRNLAKAGDALEAERVRQLGGDAALVRLDTTMKALHAQHQLVGAIIRDKTIDPKTGLPQWQPSDKRQLIDQIYRAMSFTADQGNAMMDMVEEQIKSQMRH